jgi:hypothetical protein
MKKKQRPVKKLELARETLRQVTATGVHYACEEGDPTYTCPSRLCNPNLTD